MFFLPAWRGDLRCGPQYPSPADAGSPAECNPASLHPCCSPQGWCGSTAAHCSCQPCLDFREPDPLSAECFEDERRCPAWSCIPASLWCDDVYGDCPGFEDEADCGDPVLDYTERNGTYYKLVPRRAMTYHDAQKACAVDGGHLADLKTPELQDLILSLILNLSFADFLDIYWGEGCFIGLQNAGDDDTWAWSDGTPLSDCDFSSWAPEEPRNNDGANCGMVLYVPVPNGNNIVWDDTSCDVQHCFICQIGSFVKFRLL
ncbi:C-type lectin BfL-2-like [Branchiostoma floridae x Branchiostoma japonicum]